MKKIGKIGKANLAANKKLKEIYGQKGITTCEVRFPGCYVDTWLSFAHKERREAYRGHTERLGEFEETLLACIPCHQRLDDRSKTSDEEKNNLFLKLRG